MIMPANHQYFSDGNAGFDQPVPHDGYAWWYVDALSDDGQHGITVIAFIGSVFSPYYAWARRKRPADPLNHCAINIALYGKRHRWAMTERPSSNVTRSSSSLDIGPSNLSWDGTSLTISIDEVTVPFPSRIRGKVRILPSAITNKTFTLNDDGNHRWSPIAPCARVEVTLTEPAMRWQGDGYFDMNAGEAPLDNGFTNWEWSRSAMRGGSAILYEAEQRGGGRIDLALKIDSSGRIQDFDPPQSIQLKRAGWHVRRSTRSDESHQPRVIKTLEDAPFYARSIVSGQLLGERVTMIHESLSLDRFRMPIVQAMLPFRMPRAAAG